MHNSYINFCFFIVAIFFKGTFVKAEDKWRSINFALETPTKSADIFAHKRFAKYKPMIWRVFELANAKKSRFTNSGINSLI